MDRSRLSPPGHSKHLSSLDSCNYNFFFFLKRMKGHLCNFRTIAIISLYKKTLTDLSHLKIKTLDVALLSIYNLQFLIFVFQLIILLVYLFASLSSHVNEISITFGLVRRQKSIRKPEISVQIFFTTFNSGLLRGLIDFYFFVNCPPKQAAFDIFFQFLILFYFLE